MKPGKYRILPLDYQKYLVYTKPAPCNLVKKKLTDAPKRHISLRFRIKMFVGELFPIRIENVEESGGDFLIITRKNDIKVFNLEESAVVHYTLDAERYKRIKRGYETFNSFF